MDSIRAIFISHASEDAEAARRLSAGLRTAGIHVWVDPCEPRGGDAWETCIRRQIKACELFIPVVSRHSQMRGEGDFRFEWERAAERSLPMAAEKAFLMPVVIDATPNDDARVPDRFREVQWTRLPDGEASAAFIERVQRLFAMPGPPLISVENVEVRESELAAAAPGGVGAGKSARRAMIALASLVLLGALAVGAGLRLFESAPKPAAAPAATPAGLTPAGAKDRRLWRRVSLRFAARPLQRLL